MFCAEEVATQYVSGGHVAIIPLVNALEAARIGSLLVIFASSPNDQIGFSFTIGTFATRLSAQPLRYRESEIRMDKRVPPT